MVIESKWQEWKQGSPNFKLTLNIGVINFKTMNVDVKVDDGKTICKQIKRTDNNKRVRPEAKMRH